jgi:hypothetical protein
MKPVLVILIGVFICLVILSTTSIQVILMVQRRNWSSTTKPPAVFQTTHWDSQKVCIATRDFVQRLVSELRREKTPPCVIDWGSSIGEVSLPLVKAGFKVYSVGHMDLSRMHSKLLPAVQARWKLALGPTIEECIFLDHNSAQLDLERPKRVKREIKVCV